MPHPVCIRAQGRLQEEALRSSCVSEERAAHRGGTTGMCSEKTGLIFLSRGLRQKKLVHRNLTLNILCCMKRGVGFVWQRCWWIALLWAWPDPSALFWSFFFKRQGESRTREELTGGGTCSKQAAFLIDHLWEAEQLIGWLCLAEASDWMTLPGRSFWLEDSGLEPVPF